MLKIRKICNYYPDKKIIKLLNTFDSDLLIENGKSLEIVKTNIKQIYPIRYELNIKNNNLLILHYQCDEISRKCFYLPNLNQVLNFEELKDLLENI